MLINRDRSAIGMDGHVAVGKPLVGTSGILNIEARSPGTVGTVSGTEKQAALGNTGTPLANFASIKLMPVNLPAMAHGKCNSKTQGYQQAWAGAAHQQRRQAAGWRRQ